MVKMPAHDWFLSDWLSSKDMSQADLCRETGFPKAKVSELVNGKSRYNRDVINAIADAIHVSPYELLMHPSDANRLKQLRETAISIAAESEQTGASETPEKSSVRKN